MGRLEIETLGADMYPVQLNLYSEFTARNKPLKMHPITILISMLYIYYVAKRTGRQGQGRKNKGIVYKKKIFFDFKNDIST